MRRVIIAPQLCPKQLCLDNTIFRVVSNYGVERDEEISHNGDDRKLAPIALIVVVNNDSKKDRQDELRCLTSGKSNVGVMYSKKNVGYLAGLNLGLHRALALVPDVDAYIVGNNDLEFPADFGVQLALRSKTIAERMVVAPNILTVTGIRQSPHAIRPLSRIRGLVLDGYAASFNLVRLLSRVAKGAHKVTRRKNVDDHHAEGVIFMGLAACYILSPRFIARVGSSLPRCS